jgi:hypothetical protein
MGLNLYRSRCETSSCSVDTSGSSVATYAVSNPNPDPANFKILRAAHVEGACVVEVLYPNATNYEGRKIMLYEVPLEVVLKQKQLDPHFCDGAHPAPFARFRPTEAGWTTAQRVMRALKKG